MKILIAYFSHAGQNYVSGEIKNLEKGNTEVAAEIVQKITGGDLYKIETVHEYPAEYQACCDLATKEKEEKARPELKNPVPDMSEYDKIYLGYPCWWGTIPMAVAAFLEKGNFSKKKIYPFCTSEGSGMGTSEKDIKKLASGAKINTGLAINGSKVAESEPNIAAWIN